MFIVLGLLDQKKVSGLKVNLELPSSICTQTGVLSYHIIHGRNVADIGTISFRKIKQNNMVCHGTIVLFE